MHGNVYFFSTRNFVDEPALAIASNAELTASLSAAQAPAGFEAYQRGSNPLRLGPINTPGCVLHGL